MSALGALLDDRTVATAVIAKHGTELNKATKDWVAAKTGDELQWSQLAGELNDNFRSFGDREKVESRNTALATGLVVGIGYFGALALHGFLDPRPALVVADGLNAFTLLFIMSLAIERLVEPFAPRLGLNSDETKRTISLLESTRDDPENTPADKAKTEKKIKEANVRLEFARSTTALVTWGVATGLAAVAAYALNATLFSVILNPTSSRPAYWVDLLVTALAVGAGTKPLNDLWTRMQNKAGESEKELTKTS